MMWDWESLSTNQNKSVLGASGRERSRDKAQTGTAHSDRNCPVRDAVDGASLQTAHQARQCSGSGGGVAPNRMIHPSLPEIVSGEAFCQFMPGQDGSLL